MAAVNEYTSNPANQHPFRCHDIGVVRGVTLTARITATVLLISPRVPGDPNLYPAFETTPGQVTVDAVAGWLARQDQQARIERHTLTPTRHPSPASGPVAVSDPGHAGGRER